MRIFKASLLAAALSVAGSAQADFQAGLVAIAQRDFAAAYKHFKPLAESGNAAAQVNLGNLYMKGLGVEQNYMIASRWYRAAAEQGERMAQTKLGILYYYGLGTDRNPAEAAGWFRKAAEQGDIRAQSILGSLYAAGEGVDKDLAQAFYWYTMAEEQGDKEAGKGRQSLEEELTPGQRDEALRLMHETRKQRAERDEKAFEEATAGLRPPTPAADEAANPSEAAKPAAGKGKAKRKRPTPSGKKNHPSPK